MMLPTNIRQKSGELFPNDLEKQKIFCMGAAFSLGNDLSDFEITTEQKQEEYYPCKEALEMWLAYKKEKRQTYKPRGLEALKKKLLQLSSGNPEYAKVIVEYSMGNNYTGLFAPKNNGVNSYEQQQRTYNKINSILAG
ncbi:hypothetical protein F7D97_10255 [Prevotella copri]|jgi:hypothetical protein|uniref:Uncharacterized protein n=1 Tax=Segatella copri TaxID=165179 RepID=A0A6A7VVF0_9BACT|nr:hypothetical protein [Segatella copri]UVN00900.1 MAG: hypothetical protein [Bacteriophage sp.]MQM58502.1 hypothetical protein [Segatella copri]MQN10287.1 hypothetical protein [Segatella copri]MQO61300.1 hypothetical protein [Segatella copri]MQO64053.1 hypothetical protein [Segatella copri]